MKITKENAKEEVFRFRVKYNLTQINLAALAGIHRQTIINIEDGNNIPHAKTLHKINKVLQTFNDHAAKEEDYNRIE